MKTYKTQGIVLICLAILLSAYVLAQNQSDDRLAGLKKAYKFDEWGGKTKAEYGRTTTHSIVPIRELRPSAEVTLIESKSEYGGTPDYKYFRYLLTEKDGTQTRQFTIRVAEGRSATDAHNAMMDFFAKCSAIQPFKRMSEMGREVGDIAFVGWGKNISSVSFCRNNMFVDVDCSDLNVSVVDMATKIDDAILKDSLVKPAKPPEKEPNAAPGENGAPNGPTGTQSPPPAPGDPASPASGDTDPPTSPPNSARPTNTSDSAPNAANTGRPSATQTSTAADTQSPAERGAEGPVAEATPFPWAIVIVAAAAALSLGAITTLLLTRRKKA